MDDLRTIDCNLSLPIGYTPTTTTKVTAVVKSGSTTFTFNYTFNAGTQYNPGTKYSMSTSSSAASLLGVKCYVSFNESGALSYSQEKGEKINSSSPSSMDLTAIMDSVEIRLIRSPDNDTDSL